MYSPACRIGTAPAEDSAFAHLAVTAGGATIWLHEVADQDYEIDRVSGRLIHPGDS